MTEIKNKLKDAAINKKRGEIVGMGSVTAEKFQSALHAALRNKKDSPESPLKVTDVKPYMQTLLDSKNLITAAQGDMKALNDSYTLSIKYFEFGISQSIIGFIS